MFKIKGLVIIGANEFQKKLVLKANELGYETHVFAWEEGAVAKEIADFFYPVSITDKEQILNDVRLINPIGICSIASDLAMPTVNYIANKLGLVANTLECTEVTTNKFEMRKALSYSKLPCPKYQLVKEFSEIDFSVLFFPLIVKPIDRSGSRGIRRVDNINEVEDAIMDAKSVSFLEEVLVEEYIDGKEFSVEYITQNGEHKFLQITEKFTTGAPNFIEKGHLSPARISDNKKKEIVDIVEKSLDALKVSNGASHSEVKVTSNGEIKIIEIAARMGGDYIGSDMVYISTGFDFIKNIIKVAVGEKIDLGNFDQPRNISLVGFVFNSYDRERFEMIKELYPYIIKEYEMKKDMNTVSDSSSRNGYYILEISNTELLSDILKHLNMEDLA
ncbi:ATP-grasp domain-containing protein [Peribacillus saganii]|uniref:ATP-grasp domain-containing protein n=1 Tax=Peribacillus saganii TaxID=2303992 RepID=A0A372LKU3_9BACI|nr:ATP-grasp domain-containing protein [Peribacillus saganii]RFU67130.1 ATP-grasp domain-containing protein [Peribacillus saganii]